MASPPYIIKNFTNKWWRWWEFSWIMRECAALRFTSNCLAILRSTHSHILRVSLTMFVSPYRKSAEPTKVYSLRHASYQKRGQNKSTLFFGGDGGSRTHVQNGSIRTSTSVGVFISINQGKHPKPKTNQSSFK